MRRRRSVAVLTTAILAFATLPGAAGAAARAPQTVSRAEFIYEFDRTADIQPVYPPTPDFTDVPSSSPYYGYIEAAYKDGIISGVTQGKFEPNASLTREEIAKIEVLALGDGAAAQNLANQATTFKDNGAIPAWARGYINEAVKLGLVSGYTDGYFRANQAITAADTPHFLQKFAASEVSQGTWSLTVTPSATDVGVGQQVLLATTVKNPQGSAVTGASVAYTVNSSQALISGSTFVASSPGTYTVTATYQAYGSAVTGTAEIAVYGSPASLKIVTPAQIAANGYSQYTVTVDILDQNGNTVANDSTDQVTLAASGGGAVSAINPGTATAVDGVATFTITAGSVPGATTTLTATDASITGSGHQTTATLTSAMQAAATLSISAPQYISSNISGTTATVKIQVLDQSGEPMLYGVYPFTVSITGPGTFAGGSTAAQSFVYSGNGQSGSAAPYATVTIQDIQGETGAITLTASGAGLTSATATVSAVIAGVPSGIALYPPATTSVTQVTGASGITYGIGAIDAHGYPVSDAIPVLISVKNSSGGLATNIYVDGHQQSSTSGGYVDSSAMSTGSFKLTVVGSSGSVGSYTVQAISPTNLLSASGTDSFQVTAGSVTGVTASVGSAYVSAQSPSTTVTVQAIDAYGNPVDQGGIPVTLSSPPSNAYPVTISQTSGYTNASGQFVATVSVLPYVGQSYTIDVSATVNGSAMSPSPEPTVSVQNTVATQLAVTPLDYAQGSDSAGYDVNSNYVATSSDLVRLTIKALDQYQNPVGTNDKVTLTFTGSGSLAALTYAGGGSVPQTGANQWTVQLSGGQATVDAEAWAAGQVSITAQDTSLGSGPSVTVPMIIMAGELTGFDFFSTSGTNVSTPASSGGSGISVLANTPVEVYLEPVDSQGNPTVAPKDSTAVLSDGNAGGSFRANNPYNSNVSVYTVPAGTMSQPFWYVNASANTYYLSASYQQTPTSLTLSTLATNIMAGAPQRIKLTSDDQYGNPLNGTFQVEITTPASGPDLLAQSPGGENAYVGSGEDSNGNITGGQYLSASGTGTIDLTFQNGFTYLYIEPVDAQSNATFVLQVNGTSQVASLGANVVSAAPSVITSVTAPSGDTVVGSAYNYQINAVDAFGNVANGSFASGVSLTVGGLAVSPNGAEPTALGVAATTSTGPNPTTTVVIPGGTAAGQLGSLDFTNGAATLPVVLTSTAKQTLTFELSTASSALTASASQTPAPSDAAYLALEAPSGTMPTGYVAFPSPSYGGGPWTLATVQGSVYATVPTLGNGKTYEGVIQLVDAYGNAISSGSGASQTFTLSLSLGTDSSSYLADVGNITGSTTLNLGLTNGAQSFLYITSGATATSWTDTLTIPEPTGGTGKLVLNLTYK